MNYKKWDEWYSLAEQLFTETGSINVPVNTLYRQEKLGEWFSKQRRNYNKGNISEERIYKLEDLGFEWDGMAARRKEWDDKFWKSIELLRYAGLEVSSGLLLCNNGFIRIELLYMIK